MAAILEAASLVIAERGYDAATMAEIADQSCTKIGSLYRFFPNKESLADTLVIGARENLDAVFDQFDVSNNALSARALAEHLPKLLLEQLFNNRGLMTLLDASPDGSVKREEFRNAVLARLVKTLQVCSPKLSRKSAIEIAQVILLNTKAMAANHGLSRAASEAFITEIRHMNQLYLQSRLSTAQSSKAAQVPLMNVSGKGSVRRVASGKTHSASAQIRGDSPSLKNSR